MANDMFNKYATTPLTGFMPDPRSFWNIMPPLPQPDANRKSSADMIAGILNSADPANLLKNLNSSNLSSSARKQADSIGDYTKKLEEQRKKAEKEEKERLEKIRKENEERHKRLLGDTKKSEQEIIRLENARARADEKVDKEIKTLQDRIEKTRTEVGNINPNKVFALTNGESITVGTDKKEEERFKNKTAQIERDEKDLEEKLLWKEFVNSDGYTGKYIEDRNINFPKFQKDLGLKNTSSPASQQEEMPDEIKAVINGTTETKPKQKSTGKKLPQSEYVYDTTTEEGKARLLEDRKKEPKKQPSKLSEYEETHRDLVEKSKADPNGVYIIDINNPSFLTGGKKQHQVGDRLASNRIKDLPDGTVIAYKGSVRRLTAGDKVYGLDSITPKYDTPYEANVGEVRSQKAQQDEIINSLPAITKQVEVDDKGYIIPEGDVRSGTGTITEVEDSLSNYADIGSAEWEEMGDVERRDKAQEFLNYYGKRLLEAQKENPEVFTNEKIKQLLAEKKAQFDENIRLYLKENSDNLAEDVGNLSRDLAISTINFFDEGMAGIADFFGMNTIAEFFYRGGEDISKFKSKEQQRKDKNYQYLKDKYEKQFGNGLIAGAKAAILAADESDNLLNTLRDSLVPSLLFMGGGAGALSKGSGFVAKNAAKISTVGVMGASGAGSAGGEVRTIKDRALNDDKFFNNFLETYKKKNGEKAYNALVESATKNGKLDKEELFNILQSKAARIGGGLSATVGLISSSLGGDVETGLINRFVLGNAAARGAVGKLTAFKLAGNIASSMANEGAEEAAETMSQNIALSQTADPERKITEGVGEATALGIAGGVIGGTLEYMGDRSANRNQQQNQQIQNQQTDEFEVEDNPPQLTEREQLEQLNDPNMPVQEETEQKEEQKEEQEEEQKKIEEQKKLEQKEEEKKEERLRKQYKRLFEPKDSFEEWLKDAEETIDTERQVKAMVDNLTDAQVREEIQWLFDNYIDNEEVLGHLSEDERKQFNEMVKTQFGLNTNPFVVVSEPTNAEKFWTTNENPSEVSPDIINAMAVDDGVAQNLNINADDEAYFKHMANVLNNTLVNNEEWNKATNTNERRAVLQKALDAELKNAQDIDEEKKAELSLILSGELLANGAREFDSQTEQETEQQSQEQQAEQNQQQKTNDPDIARMNNVKSIYESLINRAEAVNLSPIITNTHRTTLEQTQRQYDNGGMTASDFIDFIEPYMSSLASWSNIISKLENGTPLTTEEQNAIKTTEDKLNPQINKNEKSDGKKQEAQPQQQEKSDGKKQEIKQEKSDGVKQTEGEFTAEDVANHSSPALDAYRQSGLPKAGKAIKNNTIAKYLNMSDEEVSAKLNKQYGKKRGAERKALLDQIKEEIRSKKNGQQTNATENIGQSEETGGERAGEEEQRGSGLGNDEQGTTGDVSAESVGDTSQGQSTTESNQTNTSAETDNSTGGTTDQTGQGENTLNEGSSSEIEDDNRQAESEGDTDKKSKGRKSTKSTDTKSEKNTTGGRKPRTEETERNTNDRGGETVAEEVEKTARQQLNDLGFDDNEIANLTADLTGTLNEDEVKKAARKKGIRAKKKLDEVIDLFNQDIRDRIDSGDIKFSLSLNELIEGLLGETKNKEENDDYKLEPLTKEEEKRLTKLVNNSIRKILSPNVKDTLEIYQSSDEFEKFDNEKLGIDLQRVKGNEHLVDEIVISALVHNDIYYNNYSFKESFTDIINGISSGNEFVRDLAGKIKEYVSNTSNYKYIADELDDLVFVEQAIAELYAAYKVGRLKELGERYNIEIPSAYYKDKSIIAKLWEDLKNKLFSIFRGAFHSKITDEQVLAILGRIDNDIAPYFKDFAEKQRKDIEKVKKEKLALSKKKGYTQEDYQKAKADGRTEYDDYDIWLTVRTPAFKKWFGDWENDPQNASKTINPKTGEPLVLYHGSMRGNIENIHFGKYGFYSSSSFKVAGHYGNWLKENLKGREKTRLKSKVYPVFENIKKPFFMDNEGRNYGEVKGISFIVDEDGDVFEIAAGDKDTNDKLLQLGEIYPEKSFSVDRSYYNSNIQTDSVVDFLYRVNKNRKELIYDGAIFTNDVDGWENGKGIPSTIVVALIPNNQVKSAGFNSGLFSSSNNIYDMPLGEETIGNTIQEIQNENYATLRNDEQQGDLGGNQSAETRAENGVQENSTQYNDTTSNEPTRNGNGETRKRKAQKQKIIKSITGFNGEINDNQSTASPDELKASIENELRNTFGEETAGQVQVMTLDELRKTLPKTAKNVEKDRAKGFYKPKSGRIILVADHFAGLSTKEASLVAFHELGHKTMGAKRAEWDNELARLSSNKTISRIKNKLKQIEGYKNLNDVELTEEVMADLFAAHKSGDWASFTDKYGVNFSKELTGETRTLYERFKDFIKNFFGYGENEQVSDREVNAALGKLSLEFNGETEADLNSQEKSLADVDSYIEQVRNGQVQDERISALVEQGLSDEDIVKDLFGELADADAEGKTYKTNLPDNISNAIQNAWNGIKNTVSTVALGTATWVGTNLGMSQDAMAQDFNYSNPAEFESQVVKKIVDTNDHLGETFAVVNKQNGSLTIYDRNGNQIATTPALYGKKIGDTFNSTSSGTTPSGKFGLSYANDPATKAYGGSVIDLTQNGKYIQNKAGRYSIHRTYTAFPNERREARINSPTPADNKISLGCINVPPEFYDAHFENNQFGNMPLYVLPETPAGRTGIFSNQPTQKKESISGDPETDEILRKYNVKNKGNPAKNKPYTNNYMENVNPFATAQAVSNGEVKNAELEGLTSTYKELNQVNIGDRIAQDPTDRQDVLTTGFKDGLSSASMVTYNYGSEPDFNEETEDDPRLTPSERLANGDFDSMPIQKGVREDSTEDDDIYKASIGIVGGLEIALATKGVVNAVKTTQKRKSTGAKKLLPSQAPNQQYIDNRRKAWQNYIRKVSNDIDPETIDKKTGIGKNWTQARLDELADLYFNIDDFSDSFLDASSYIQSRTSDFDNHRTWGNNRLLRWVFKTFGGATPAFDNALGRQNIKRFGYEADSAIPSVHFARIKALTNGAMGHLQRSYLRPLHRQTEYLAQDLGKSTKQIRQDAGELATIDHILDEGADHFFRGLDLAIQEAKGKYNNLQQALIAAASTGNISQYDKIDTQMKQLKDEIQKARDEYYKSFFTYHGNIADDGQTLLPGGFTEQMLNDKRTELQNKYGNDFSRLKKHSDEIVDITQKVRNFGATNGVFGADSLNTIQKLGFTNYVPLYTNPTENENLELDFDKSPFELLNELTQRTTNDILNLGVSSNVLKNILGNGTTRDFTSFGRSGSTSEKQALNAYENLETFAQKIAARTGTIPFAQSVQQLFEGTVGESMQTVNKRLNFAEFNSKPKLDANGNPILDANGKPLMENMTMRGGNSKFKGLIRFPSDMSNDWKQPLTREEIRQLEQDLGMQPGKLGTPSQLKSRLESLQPIRAKGYNADGELKNYDYYFIEPDVSNEINQSFNHLARTRLTDGRGFISDIIGAGTKLESKLMTSYNLVWNGVNFMRDSLERWSIMLNRPVKDRNGNLVSKWDLTKTYEDNIARLIGSPTVAMPEIYRYLTENEVKTELQRQLQEAVRGGGIQLMNDLLRKDSSILLDNKNEVIEKVLKYMEHHLNTGVNKIGGGGIRNTLKEVNASYISAFVELPQVISALAAYQTYQQLGVNKQESLNRTRDMFDPLRTRNNLVSGASKWYPFVRATLSGHYNLIRTLTQYWKPGERGWMTGYLLGGTATAYAFYALAAGFMGDDDDGIPKIAKMSIQQLMQGIPIPAYKKGFFSVPTGFGINKVFSSLAAILFKYNHGQLSRGDAFKSTLDLIFENTTPLKPVHSRDNSILKSVGLSIAPYMFKTAFESAFGQRSNGSTLYKVQKKLGQKQHQIDDFTVPDKYKSLAKILHDWSGGFLDFNPETLELFADNVFQGPLKVIPQNLMQDRAEKTLGHETSKGEFIGLALNLIGAGILSSPTAFEDYNFIHAFQRQRVGILEAFNIDETGKTMMDESGNLITDAKAQGLDATQNVARRLAAKGASREVINFVVNNRNFTKIRNDLQRDLRHYLNIHNRHTDPKVRAMAKERAEDLWNRIEGLQKFYIKNEGRSWYELLQEFNEGGLSREVLQSPY